MDYFKSAFTIYQKASKTKQFKATQIWSQLFHQRKFFWLEVSPWKNTDFYYYTFVNKNINKTLQIYVSFQVLSIKYPTYRNRNRILHHINTVSFPKFLHLSDCPV